MAKFVYKLQNVLDIKDKMETQARSAYAEASHKLRLEQEKLEQLVAGKRQLEDKFRELATGTIDPAELQFAKQAIDFQRELIKGKLVDVRVAEKNLEMARIRLNEAMKDRKTHERLKEKAFEDFLVELAEEEKKEIDELVSYRYGAKQQ